eukprot:TRINITY_DN6663_c0_g4_i1.p1 TRINITY_DN6663_c0_g4~~TRINITY_DN6663_c0_g4_i1.p1  ORF type:complete len:725 (-),score=183.03 TRINITY_DN6663_c0_g4_i1:349-2523(-)
MATDLENRSSFSPVTPEDRWRNTSPTQRSFVSKSSDAEAATERLYRQAQQSQEAKLKALQLADQERAAQHTSFQSLPKSRELASRRFADNSSPEGRPAPNYGHLLYQEATTRAAQRKMNEAQKDAEDETYSFQPEISELARALPTSEPVEQRLEVLAMERQRKLLELQMQQQSERDRDLTFQPAINHYFPLPDRSDDFLQSVEEQENKRALKLAQLASQKHEEHRSINTGRPSISDYSRSLQRDEPIHERLYAMARAKESPQVPQTVEDYDQATGQRLFVPQVSASAATAQPREGSVQEDLYQDAISRRMRKAKLESKQEMEAHNLRSQSKLGASSRKLAKAKFEKDLKKVFEQLDTGGTGTLTFMQLGEALRRLNIFRGTNNGDYHAQLRAVNEASLHERLWKALITDEGGRIHLQTFSKFLALVVDKTETLEAVDDTPVIALAREFSKLAVNRVAYAPLKGTKSVPADDCTFTPSINPRSRVIESQLTERHERQVGAGTLPRHELLFAHARSAEEKKEIERLQRQDSELDGCTFTPTINKDDGRIKVRKSDYLDLYQMKPRRGPLEGEKTSAEREVDEHCTFTPNTALTRTTRPVTAPTHEPRGFKESVSRLRTAKEERDQLQAELERASANSTPRKKGPVKPFTFLLDTRKNRPPPLLYMDVSLGPGRTGRIGIHAGDDPRVLARNFAATYHLDERLTARLEDLLRQHMEALGPGRGSVEM